MMKTFCKSFDAFILADEGSILTRAVKPSLVYEAAEEEVKEKIVHKEEEIKESQVSIMNLEHVW